MDSFMKGRFILVMMTLLLFLPAPEILYVRDFSVHAGPL
jgi:hypothetical protein